MPFQASQPCRKAAVAAAQSAYAWAIASNNDEMDIHKAMKIGIIGAGAIGGFFAARLALAGHTVSVLAREATLSALRTLHAGAEKP